MRKQWGFGVYVLVLVLFVVTTKTCFSAGNVTTGCFAADMLALLKLKHSFIDEFGMLSSWSVGEDCCDWERVGCNRNTGRVVKLDLRGSLFGNTEQDDEFRYLVEQDDEFHYLEVGIGGEVNLSALAELEHLRYLDLSQNHFRASQIPEFIGSLKQLKYLNLSYAGFAGIIPHHLGNLSNLNVLDLNWNIAYNYYSTLIADDVTWVSGLSSLRFLDLSEVDLSQALNMNKVLYMTPSLIELRLSGCGLSNAHLLPPLFSNSSCTLPKIQRLDLSRNLFQGPLPPFIQNITSLEFLDLSFYNLTDQPLSFGNLLNMFPSLSELSLYDCGLHNSHLVPSHFNFSTLSNVWRLGLGSNSIEGNFPRVLRNMSSLRVLDLSDNTLHFSNPVMKSLVHLDLSSNELYNIDEIGLWNQCHLKWLDVSNNNVKGEMVGPSANLSKCGQFDLEKLDLSRNHFTSSIPKTLGRLTKLRVLNLHFNGFTGPIPASLGNLTALRVMDLGFNNLVGPIPISLGKLSALESLYLDVNHLTGSIPASLGDLVSLKIFSVSSNMLNGTIPFSLGQLIYLTMLDVSENFLEGLVSETHFVNISRLMYFAATSNWMLTFNMSDAWIPPFQLKYLLLRSCMIGPEFPQWLRTQRKLESLVLSNASISGPLPRWFRDIPHISFLDLSHNLIAGPLTNLPRRNLFKKKRYYTRFLFLQNNVFDGSIPKSLCKWTTLQYLDISRNRLSGKLPQCIKKLQDLSVIILSSNRLSGVIPSSLFYLSSPLQWLQLNNNTFQGELPLSIGNCKFLEVIDLGENKLFGSIPKCLGRNITGLRVLRLHKNKFSGIIPVELCQNSNLQILDLAHNNLTGVIPHCFVEFVVMAGRANASLFLNGTYGIEMSMNEVMHGVLLEYTTILQYVVNMDLSSNHLVGEIPKDLSSCYGLMGLNLSHNHLIGAIPSRIDDMKTLMSLDLSGNKLSGTIPPSIAALTFLSHLNLSHNDLSGRIPIGFQLQTLNDPSIYAGNRELCGNPLPKDCSNDEDSAKRSKAEKHEAGHEPSKVWFYLDIISGFATGFWGIIGVLLFKKHWRERLFRLVEVTVDKIHVGIVVRLATTKRKRGTLKQRV